MCLPPTLLAALALAVATPAPALAGPSVTLNGVPIDGATGQRFENCAVEIDAQGNIHITAKGYAVKGEAAQSAPGLATWTTGTAAPPAVAPPASPPAATPTAATTAATTATPSAAAQGALPARLTRRYFLALQQNQPDGAQYDVEVFVNATWIRTLRSADPPPGAVEVTRYLRPGPNRLTLAATKKLAGAERRYYSSDVYLKVTLGAGNVGGDHVMIDEPLAVMTRTAAEVDDKTEEYVVEAR
jgi:hypothetical protein